MQTKILQTVHSQLVPMIHQLLGSHLCQMVLSDSQYTLQVSDLELCTLQSVYKSMLGVYRNAKNYKCIALYIQFKLQKNIIQMNSNAH